MDKQRKIAITLMIIGVCIPLIALPFVSGYDKDKGLWKNFLDVGIKITKDTPGKAPDVPDAKAVDQKKGLIKKMPDRIPFRLFLVPMFLLIFIGIVMIDKAKTRAGDNASGTGDM